MPLFVRVNVDTRRKTGNEKKNVARSWFAPGEYRNINEKYAIDSARILVFFILQIGCPRVSECVTSEHLPRFDFGSSISFDEDNVDATILKYTGICIVNTQ